MTDSIRIDKWLWFARFCKSRSLAKALVEDGAVRLNGLVVGKASTPVKIGDRVEFALRGHPFAVEVTAPGERRGPAAEAALLYRDLSPGAVDRGCR
jgi:ribosome-associated heat shock protein Hsp15